MKGCIQYILLLSIAFVKINSARAQEYVSFHYTQQNGLPQNSVVNVWFDKHQFLWLTTESGLVRFDGRSFKTFQSSSNPQISNDRFRWIHKTPDNKLISSNADGQLWQIIQNNIYPVSGQKHFNYELFTYGIPSLETIIAIENSDKYFLRDQNVKIYPVVTIAVNKQEYYALGNGYIYRFKGLVKTDSIDIHSIQQPELLFRSGMDFYLKAAGREIYHLNSPGNTLTRCSVKSPDAGFPFKLYWKSGYDQALVVCNNKLYALVSSPDRRSFSTKLLLHALPVQPSHINQVLYVPQKDFIVIGTTTDGFYLFKPSHFKTVNVPGLSGAYGQIQHSDSSIMEGHGYEITASGVKKRKYEIRAENGVLLRDQSDGIWYSGNDSLYYYRNGTKTFMLRDDENRFNAIYRNGDTVLVSSFRTIYLFVKGELKSLTALPVSASKSQETSRPFCFIRFKNRYYYGCSDGIFSFRIINSKANFIEKVADIPNVRYLYPYEDYILGCSYGTGFFALSGDKLITFPLDKKLHLSKSHSIRIDKMKRVFISTNNGLFYTRLESLKNYISKTQKSIHYQYLNDIDGILNVEFNGGCIESSVSLPNGNFSFSNMGGFVFFTPENITDNFPKGPFYLDNITIDGEQQPLSDTLKIPSDAEQVSIGFTNAYWGNSYNIELDYKIETYHKDWIPHSSEDPELSLIHVPSGTHRLLVRIRTGFGDNDYHIRAFTLIKEKRFVETVSFFVLGIIVLTLVILLLNRIYNKRLRSQNQLLEMHVSARTKELRESNSNLQKSQQELLQAVNVKNKLISIISHDIVTPIKFISIVSRNFKSENNNVAQEREVIREIHHTSQRLHENAQNILNWVRYQNNLIKVHATNIAPYSIVEEISDLLHEIAWSRKNTIVNDVDMDEIIKTDKTIITIILQNLISNAVKYTHSSVIHISSRVHNGKYTISISDDGQGISKQNLLRIENIRNKSKSNMFDDSADGTGLGFVIIFELADLIGAIVEIESSQEAGTTVRVTL